MTLPPELQRKIEDWFPSVDGEYQDESDLEYARREGAKAMAELLWPCVEACQFLSHTAKENTFNAASVTENALKKAGLE